MIEGPVTIVLALHNGGRYIAEQLASFGELQGDWRLIVSDDASRDDGPDLVRAFAATRPAGQVTLVPGPAKGAPDNFLHLLDLAPPDRPLAFSDQDDVWLPRRLALGLEELAGHSEPAVHLGSTLVCDEKLRVLSRGPAHRRRPGFLNALVQGGGPGNAMTLNPAAVQLLKRARIAAVAAEIPAHDWWVYQIITGAGGAWLTSEEVVLLYRQHDRNVVGRNDTAIASLRRAAMLVDGTFAGWMAANLQALHGARSLLTPGNLATLTAAAAALRQPGPRAAARLRGLGLHRDSTGGTAAFLAAVSAGRMRGRGVQDTSPRPASHA